MSKEHFDFISRHYTVIESNVWLYHVSYSEKKGLRVKIANGDLCKPQNTERAFYPRPCIDEPSVFFEYSNDDAYTYCNKVVTRTDDGTERLDCVVLDVRDDDKGCETLASKYRNERDRIIEQFNQKIDGIYNFFKEERI